MIQDTAYYCHLFSKLRRDRKNGGAPHKPILLISIIQAFQQNLFNDNQINITPSLVGLFNSNWNNLVETEHHRSFALPFNDGIPNSLTILGQCACGKEGIRKLCKTRQYF